MKKASPRQTKSDGDAMRPEYDFSGGVRGKHYKAYRQGHSVTVHKRDGSTFVQFFGLEDGAVMLDPDVREYFPDSESVNQTLRAHIPASKKRKSTARAR